MYTRLKHVIVFAGLKQTYLAQRVGISDGLMSKYVTGQRPIPKHTLKALASVLGVSQKSIVGVCAP